MRRTLLVLLVAGCGGGSATDPGGGTHTLLVSGSIENEGTGASILVDVRRGIDHVTNAVVTVDAGNGGFQLNLGTDNRYHGVSPAWSHRFRLSVVAGMDNLDGSVEGPDPATIVSPPPAVAFDPHQAPGGVVRVSWSGAAAETVEVDVRDFQWGPNPDTGFVDVPAVNFQNTSEQVRIRRVNSTALVGGVAGSMLTARNETRTDLSVVNPF